METRLKYPEFSGGAGKGPNLGLGVGGTGEGTVVGHRGSLTRDLDLNHNLDLFGPARTFKGNPSEWGCGFITQDTDGELLMLFNCPEFTNKGGPKRMAAPRSPAPSGTPPGTQLKTPEYPEWGLESHAETTDCERVMNVTILIYPRSSRLDRDAVHGNCRRRRPATEHGVSAKRIEGCRPFRAVISLLWLPGVATESRARGACASRPDRANVFFDVITWACARRTRSSPGYHMGGLRSQSRILPRSPSSSGLRPNPYRLRREEIPEMPEWGL